MLESGSIPVLDAVIVAIYLLLSFGFGIYAHRLLHSDTKGEEGYFLAGRKMPGWLTGVSSAVTAMNSDVAPTYCGVAVVVGLSISWFYLSRFGVALMIAAMLTALTVAREWERGTMEQLAATPVHRAEVILGKLVPYLGIGLVDVLAAILIGMFVFDVPFRGNPLLLAIMTTMFLVGSLGLGIFISAVLRSQLLATQVAMIATFLPALLLSGLMFDLNMMPPVLQGISALVPARYFITVMRGIFLKDVGIPVLWGQGLAMVAYAVLGLGLAIRAFRKEIE